jgi:hypothetical protein
MCMTCASQAPAAAGALSGMLVYGSAVGAAGVALVARRRSRTSAEGSELDALAHLTAPKDRDSDGPSAQD